jgi:ribosomal protein S18 acetylase RimI-like enzyme
MTHLPLVFQPPDSAVPLRPVRLSDVNSLYADCWPTRPFATIYNLVQRAIRSATDGRGLGLVVAGAGDRVQGYGQMLLWPTCAEISDLVVVESCRGRGYGTAIVQSLVRAAMRMGAEEAEIGASLNNPRAAALYRRLGFRDSHTVALNLGSGGEHVLYLRLNMRNVRLPMQSEQQTR